MILRSSRECIPCEEERKTDSLKDAGKSTYSNGIKRTLLSNDLGDELEEQN
jgi:hypothetical protein